MSSDAKDDQVLAQLYKKSAKETPSPGIDGEILDYAAKKALPVRGHNHFAEGWKVPLSLAASVLVVFALLIQLDQHPEQLEILPIPTSDKSDGKSPSMDEINIGDVNKPDYGIHTPDHEVLNKAGESPRDTDEQITPSAVPSNSKSKIKLEQQGSISQPEITPQKSRKFDDSQLNNELEMDQVPDEGPSPSAKSRASSLPVPETARPADTLERKQEFSTDTLSQNKPSAIQEEENFSPTTAKDWLIMIEQLIARKDYAEAARQLERFKQSHPEVNVSKLESKLP